MPPIPRLCLLRTPRVTGGSVTIAEYGCWTRLLLVCTGLPPSPLPLPVASLESCHVVKCMCLCAEVFFSCSHTVLLYEHSLGVAFFFSPPFPHVMLQFFPQPCLPVLSTPLSVCVYVWTGGLPFSLVYYATGYVAGTCVLVYLCCNNKRTTTTL